MDNLTTTQAADLFGVHTATVRNWSIEFAQYLSPGATPPGGKRRSLTREDLEVFALIRDSIKQGLNYPDVHAALANGQRGQLPEYSEVDTALVLAEPRTQLVLLQNELRRLQAELKAAEAAREQASGQNSLLKQLLEEKEVLIRNLYREIGRLEAN